MQAGGAGRGSPAGGGGTLGGCGGSQRQRRAGRGATDDASGHAQHSDGKVAVQGARRPVEQIPDLLRVAGGAGDTPPHGTPHSEATLPFHQDRRAVHAAHFEHGKCSKGKARLPVGAAGSLLSRMFLLLRAWHVSPKAPDAHCLACHLAAVCAAAAVVRDLELCVCVLLQAVAGRPQVVSYGKAGMTEARVSERKSKLAAWLREGLIKLGPTFIKIGALRNAPA